jgi:hypothetical protein
MTVSEEHTISIFRLSKQRAACFLLSTSLTLKMEAKGSNKGNYTSVNFCTVVTEHGNIKTAHTSDANFPCNYLAFSYALITFTIFIQKPMQFKINIQLLPSEIILRVKKKWGNF